MDDKELIKQFIESQQTTILHKKDLTFLIKTAILHQEITMSKGAELLGLSVREMDALAHFWMEEKATRTQPTIIKNLPQEMSNPIRYLTSETPNVKNNYPGFSEEGFYFWNENWENVRGPFETEEACKAGLKTYAKTLKHEDSIPRG